MQPLDIEHFHQKAMFIKVHLDFVHWLQVQLMGLVPKNKGQMNFNEHCDLRKEYIYAAFLDFWRRRWISNRLMGVPIDFHWLQLTLLNPHDSLQVKQIAKIFLNLCQKNFQFTFCLQLLKCCIMYSTLPKNSLSFVEAHLKLLKCKVDCSFNIYFCKMMHYTQLNAFYKSRQAWGFWQLIFF